MMGTSQPWRRGLALCEYANTNNTRRTAGVWTRSATARRSPRRKRTSVCTRRGRRRPQGPAHGRLTADPGLPGRDKRLVAFTVAETERLNALARTILTARPSTISYVDQGGRRPEDQRPGPVRATRRDYLGETFTIYGGRTIKLGVRPSGTT